MTRKFKVVWTVVHLASLILSVYSLNDKESARQQVHSPTENTTDYYLPTDVIPTEYSIHIKPYLVPNNFSFNGKESIIADVKKATSKIVLHANQINVLTVDVFKINRNSGSEIRLNVKEFPRIEKYQFLNIVLSSPVETNSRVKIVITFAGKLEIDQAGFFRRSYKTGDETRWVMGSHMEATSARKAFPCFDEPAFKAVFKISVDVPRNYFAISNMPAKSSKNGLYEFEPTPPMPTYLIALVVSDFKSLTEDNGRHHYRISSNPSLTNLTSYALSVVSKAVDFFESRVQLPYALPKLDAIVMPGFLASMENWGAVMYRENYALYDPAVTSIIDKRTVRNALTHEISHQWFGNPISPKKWDYLWLSEAFGAYFEYHAHERAIDSWNLESIFLVDVMQPSFAADQLADTQPMTRHVYSPDEILSIFDTVVYSKGASVVRMIEKLLGPKCFYGALTKYLRSNQLSAVPELLYSAFEEELKSSHASIGISFTQFFNNWTSLAGFPVVQANFNNDVVRLSQKRFYLSQPEGTANNSTWIIPISWATASDPNFSDTRNVTWMTEKKKSITIKNASKDWVVLNKQQAGYYRVNYDDAMWQRIVLALKGKNPEAIHPLNRAALVDDILNFARAGTAKYDFALSALEYLTQETSYIPWRAAIEGFTYLRTRLLDNGDIYKYFTNYVSSLLEPVYKKLGFNDKTGENELDATLRIYVIQWLCFFDHPDCVQKSVDAFKKLRQNKNNLIPANQQNTVYCTAIRHGSTDDWNFLLGKFEKSINSIEKMNIYSALACSKNTNNLERLLSDAINPNAGVQRLDLEELFSYVISASNLGAITTMRFIGNNYDKILEYLNDESVIAGSLNKIAGRLSTRNLLKQFEDFTKANEKKLINVSDFVQVALSSSVSELDWYDRNSPAVLKWLKANYSR